MKTFHLALAVVMLSVSCLGQARDSETSAVTFEGCLEYAGVAVRQEGWHIWGTSPVIGPRGNVHLFVARWPVSAKFDPGWRTWTRGRIWTKSAQSYVRGFCSSEKSSNRS